ncbi:MAG: glutaredoxin family protein [Caldimonas sp.]|nr:glutaredoxin family protein [Pseudomonadota bacterium]
MTSRAPSHFLRCLPRAALVALAVLAATASQAQFKVIGTDGKVTYTDREPNADEGKVVPLGARAAATQDLASDLPFELRQVASKYPVTLYVVTTACEPCASARQMLKQRGIPFSERTVSTTQDSDALQRLTGAQDAPTLTVGSQTLRGLSPDVWNSYLDAAGYPRTSRLPTSYQYRPATPLVEQAPAASARADSRSDAPPAPAARSALPASPSGIRF